jgi:methylphosphotriester-DNA--protein-cysteine methyltransferase
MPERLFVRLDDDPVHGPEADIPAGTLRAWPVRPSLRSHVAHILEYREVIPPGTETRERVVPDGAVRLVFNLGSAPSVEAQAGRPAEVIGASATPVVVTLRGRVEGLSITLRPGAAAALLGIPAGEFAETTVALEDVWRGAGADLRDQLAEADDDEARVERLQAALHQRLVSGEATAHRGAAHAARIIAGSGGRTRLGDVAAAIGVGERRLQQLFHTHVGLGPRTWSRLARLHSCIRQLRDAAPPPWAQVAVEGGFYDQSHLVNEFRALCGLTPTEFLSSSISRSSKTPA